MAGHIATKSSKDNSPEQAEGHQREFPRQLTPAGSYDGILALQRSAGNRAVSHLLQSGKHEAPLVQPKLTIGQPGNTYEQEADRVADQVMRMPAESLIGTTLSASPQHIQRQCGACASGQVHCRTCAEEEEIQRKPLASTITPLIQRQRHFEEVGEQGEAPSLTEGTPSWLPSALTDVQAHIQPLRGDGQPLPEATRAFFEARFNYDFSHVRTHSDLQASETAQTVNARAFTLGSDVFFRAGEYAPESATGQRLLAHELTHVVQQTSSLAPATATIQRQAAPAEAAAARTEEVTTPGLIVEDAATALTPGQMKKSAFLAELRSEVCTVAEAALAGTGQTTDGCPYLNSWFSYYSQQDSQHIERAIRRYAPEAAGVPAARDYIPLIAQRVRRGVEVWVKTGKITGVPEGIPADMDGASASQGQGNATSAGNIQFKGRDGGARNASNPQAIQAQLGEGHPLDGGVRSRMESAFGRSFSQVRVHTGVTATGLSDRLNARALTVGEHIAFGSNEYQPGSLMGDAIIAHELAHVMQQESADNDIAPTQIGQGSYDQFEEDADQSAVAAAVSLWGRTKGVLNGITQKLKPRLKSGLQLQACRRTVKQCPRGLRWAVVGQPTATGPVCVCAWRCLPPGAGFSLSSGSGGSSGPAISCTNKDRFGRCPGEPDYVTVDEDYEIKNQGTVVGVGAHMSPLGGQAACGCLPLDLEGDPTGEKEVHAPLLPPGLDVTALAGMRGRPRRDPRTGAIAPGAEGERPTTTPTRPTIVAAAPPRPGGGGTPPTRGAAGTPAQPSGPSGPGGGRAPVRGGTATPPPPTPTGTTPTTTRTTPTPGGTTPTSPGRGGTRSPGQTTPTPGALPGAGRLPVPSTPGGMSLNQFGTRVMRWGTGDETARARRGTLAREELQRAGVTREMAEAWRDFYINEKARNPSNPSAAGRADLMQHAVDLLSGGD
jgi:hypothetical protein